MVQPLWKTVWQFVPELNTVLTYDPAVMLLGNYSSDVTTYVLSRAYTDMQMFTATLCIIVKTGSNQDALQ